MWVVKIVLLIEILDSGLKNWIMARKINGKSKNWIVGHNFGLYVDKLIGLWVEILGGKLKNWSEGRKVGLQTEIWIVRWKIG